MLAVHALRNSGNLAAHFPQPNTSNNEKKVMKNSNIKITYLNQSMAEFVKSIVEIQKKLASESKVKYSQIVLDHLR